MPIVIFEMKCLITVSEAQLVIPEAPWRQFSFCFFLDEDLLMAHRGRMPREMIHGCEVDKT